MQLEVTLKDNDNLDEGYEVRLSTDNNVTVYRGTFSFSEKLSVFPPDDIDVVEIVTDSGTYHFNKDGEDGYTCDSDC